MTTCKCHFKVSNSVSRSQLQYWQNDKIKIQGKKAEFKFHYYHCCPTVKYNENELK